MYSHARTFKYKQQTTLIECLQHAQDKTPLDRKLPTSTQWDLRDRSTSRFLWQIINNIDSAILSHTRNSKFNEKIIKKLNNRKSYKINILLLDYQLDTVNSTWSPCYGLWRIHGIFLIHKLFYKQKIPTKLKLD